MKNLFTYALTAAFISIGLSACSEESPSVSENYNSRGNAIRFAPHTSYATRSSDLTANNLNSFQVYAYSEKDGGQVLFMDNVKVSRTEGNTWTYSPIEYWPNVPVDFYAFAPDGQWAGANGPLETAAPYNNYPGTTDLIYAESLGLTGEADAENAQVILNFRHALSKVTLNLSSSNDNIVVKVTNVVIANIMSKGVFHFPTSSTTSSTITDKNSVCTWSDLSANTIYVFHMAQHPDEVISLTTTPTDLSKESPDSGGPKYMLPQPLSYRSQGTGTMDTYIAIMGSVYDKDTGLKLWPNSNTPPENTVPGSTFGDGLLKFPLGTSQFSEWQPGYHYIYNLVINANPEMGTINFGTPSVDGFIEEVSDYQ